MKHRLPLLLVLVIAVLALAGCGSANTISGDAGFWNGLWDGFTAPFAFIGNLFGGEWSIYEIKNTGNWYDFGYLIGISVIFGGSGASASR